VEASPFEQAMLAPSRDEPPRESTAEPAIPPAAQDNSPQPAAMPEPVPAAAPAPPPPSSESPPATAAPLFRARRDIPKSPPQDIPAVIPIVRAPDDPGIDDEPVSDEFAEQINPPPRQAGGWRGFLSRWGG
jgi:HemY protein